MTSISSLPSATRIRTLFSPGAFSTGTKPTLTTARLTALAARLTLVLLLSTLSSSCTPLRSPITLPSAKAVPSPVLPYASSGVSESPTVTARPRPLSPPEPVGRARWDCVRRGGGFHASSSDAGRARRSAPAGANETPGADWPWVGSPISLALPGRDDGMSTSLAEGL